MNDQALRRVIFLVLFGMTFLLINPFSVLAGGGHGHKGETGHHPHGDVTKKVVNAISEMHHHLGERHMEWGHMKVELNKIKHEIQEIEAHARVELIEAIEGSLRKKDKESFSHNLLSVCYYMMVDKFHQTEDELENFRSAKEHFQNAALAYKPISLALAKRDPKLDKDIKMAFRKAAKTLGNPKNPSSAEKARFHQQKEKIEAYLHSYFYEEEGP